MRWPFGPPHLTLKPSKKKQNKKNKKNITKNNTKKQKKRKTKKEKEKNTKIPKKELFSYQSKFSFFWQGIQKLPFLTPWPRKRAPKNTIKIGVSACFFLERSYASRNGHFWTKKTQIQKFQLSFFFLPFFSFKNKKTQKSAETPIFIVF